MSEKPTTEAPKRAPRARERGPDKGPRKTRDLKSEALKHEADEAKINSPWRKESLEIGAGYLVRLLWLVTSAVSFIIGGKLSPLTDEELTSGAREALPLVRRFPALLVALMFAGLPLWFIRTVVAKFAWTPKAKPQEKPKVALRCKVCDAELAPAGASLDVVEKVMREHALASPACTKPGATVHEIHAPKAGA